MFFLPVVLERYDCHPFLEVKFWMNFESPGDELPGLSRVAKHAPTRRRQAICRSLIFHLIDVAKRLLIFAERITGSGRGPKIFVGRQRIEIERQLDLLKTLSGAGRLHERIRMASDDVGIVRTKALSLL